MNKFLYIFGFITPEEAGRKSAFRSKTKKTETQQHSLAIFIEAPTEQEALLWGEEISEEFTRRLFHNKTTSWKAMKLPHCIANESFLECASEEMHRIPIVPCGEYPDFASMSR